MSPRAPMFPELLPPLCSGQPGLRGWEALLLSCCQPGALGCRISGRGGALHPSLVQDLGNQRA